MGNLIVLSIAGAQIAADGGMLAVNGLRSGLLGVSKPEYA
jgi:hypothetical protein